MPTFDIEVHVLVCTDDTVVYHINSAEWRAMGPGKYETLVRYLVSLSDKISRNTTIIDNHSSTVALDKPVLAMRAHEAAWYAYRKL